MADVENFAESIAASINVGLTEVLGFHFDEAGPDRVVLSWTTGPQHLQPYGIAHGGVYCAAAETSASVGAALWFGERGKVVGVANHTNFLRSVTEGARVVASATPVHRGRSQQLWQIEMRDEQDRLVSRGEVRLQNLAG
jgi:1,4-dihydroxy-2-naphthoyl-CoA hydrolase